MAHRCGRCGETFANKYQLGPHRRQCVGSMLPEDTCSSFSANDTSSGSEAGSQLETQLQFEAQSEESEAGSQTEERRQFRLPLFQLAQRQRHTRGLTTPVRLQSPLRGVQHNPHLAGDYIDAQKAWVNYVRTVYNLCSSQFWDLFHVVNQEKGACADAVLKWTKHLLQAQPKVIIVNTFVTNICEVLATLTHL